MISVISPIYNEAENISELYERTRAVLEGLSEEFEFIMVENGSTDRSLEIIKGLQKKDRRVKFVSLSRNFGHQGAIIAGLAHASGDAVISLDGDLQHPPELISRLVALWKEGNDVVFTIKKRTEKDRGALVTLTRIFYKLISAISEIELAYGQSDYRLLSRQVVDAILQIPEKQKFLRGMVQWVGFRQIGVEYEVDQRKRGASKFSFGKYINFALDGIFSFGRYPLHLIMIFSLTMLVFSSLYLIMVIVIWILKLLGIVDMPVPRGWTDLIMAICFLGSVQLMAIGILGEYVERIFEQTKSRPSFIVKEKSI